MANAAIGHRRQPLPNRVGDPIGTKRTAGFSAYHSLMNIDTLIGSNRLLDHSFYRRWEEGQLRDGELSSYASQYRHFEAMLPDFLSTLVDQLDDAEARQLVEANLADEVAGPQTHLELFDRFALAVGGTAQPASPAMATLIGAYDDAAASGDPSFALGVLAGYEVQAAEVATTKGDGLATRYEVGDDGCAFWRLHAEVEVDHAEWTLAAAQRGNTEAFIAGARASSSVWWAFLDEREALAVA